MSNSIPDPPFPPVPTAMQLMDLPSEQEILQQLMAEAQRAQQVCQQTTSSLPFPMVASGLPWLAEESAPVNLNSQQAVRQLPWHMQYAPKSVEQVG